MKVQKALSVFLFCFQNISLFRLGFRQDIQVSEKQQSGKELTIDFLGLTSTYNNFNNEQILSAHLEKESFAKTGKITPQDVPSFPLKRASEGELTVSQNTSDPKSRFTSNTTA